MILFSRHDFYIDSSLLNATYVHVFYKALLLLGIHAILILCATLVALLNVVYYVLVDLGISVSEAYINKQSVVSLVNSITLMAFRCMLRS